MKKSQVTMLMIIGLVLFIAVSLVLYISKSSVKRSAQQSIKKAQGLDVQPIKELVTKCLDKLSKDAVELLGKQGGYIYTSQGGTFVDYSNSDIGKFFVAHNGLKVSYNIKQLSLYNFNAFSSEIPEYPWALFPYKSLNSNDEIFDGLFGRDDTPPLTPAGGSHSMQIQIETYIDNNLPKCMDFDIFKKQGFEISYKQPKTTAVIGINDITIESKIPTTVSHSSADDVVEINNFTTNLNVRLRDIYYFTKELIENDIENIKFNISDISNNKDFMSVKVVRDFYSNDDLVIVKDEKSLVYGKPFEYVFARKNRAPALHYIRENIIELHPDKDNYIEVKESDLLKQAPKAEDLDEDDITFSIFIGSSDAKAELPKKFDADHVEFRIQVSDGKLIDYQMITANRK